MKWGEAPLGRVVRFTGGGTPSKARSEFWQGPIPWVSPKDMVTRDISDSRDHISESAVAASATQVVPVGSVLIVVRSGILAHTLPIGIARVPLSINQDMKALRPTIEALSNEYLAYFLQARSKRVLSLCVKRGPTVHSLDVDQLSQIPIPLPTLSEQQHIVEILDQADALRRKRAEADAKAARIVPALFYKMFGDPVSNSSRWEKTTLGELSLEFRYGTSTKCGVERMGLPVLRIPNVIGGEIDVSELKYADLPDDEAGRLLLEPGDLLFVRTNGNPAYVGRCAIFDLAERYAFASYLIRTRIDHERADPWFVAEYLRTSEGRRAMAPYIRTTAGQSNISVEGLQQIPVLLPPLSLQRQFRVFIATMRASQRKEEQSRSKFKALFDSMLHRAFSGDLTAKWRESHMKELLVEMQKQSRDLAVRSNDNESPVVKANRHAGYDMYNKAALAAYIVRRCHEASQPLGRVKLAKLYYLAQSKAKIELTETFAKRAAGPLDDEIFKFLSLAQKNRWVILDAKQGRLKPMRPGPESGRAAEQAAKVLGAAKPLVDEMLDQMKSWSYQTLERWATVLEAVQLTASAGQLTNVETVKDMIRKHPEWVPKLNRQEFSDANIEATLRGLSKFGFVANHN